jgi:PAS domain S-box-containing protein
LISHTIQTHPDLEGVGLAEFLDFYWKHSVDGAALVDKNNRWVSPNPKICSLLGHPASKLEQMTWMDVTIEPDRKEDLDAVRAVIAGEISHYVMDKTYITRMGNQIRARLTVYPIRTPTEDFGMFLSQIQEIDGVPVVAEDELRVVWRFADKHKKALVVFLVMWAFAGGTFVESIPDAIAFIAGQFGG